MNTLDTTQLNFGKHKGETPEQLSDSDPSYVVWLYENVNPKVCSRSLYNACEELCRDEHEGPDAGDGHDDW